MNNKKSLDSTNIFQLAFQIANQIYKDFPSDDRIKLIYGVPRGGVPSLYAVLRYLSDQDFMITEVIEDADIIIDDIIDSGNTKNKCLALNPNAKFYALIDKEKNPDNTWWIFPWETNELASIEDAFIRLRQFYNIEDINENTFKYLIEELLLKLK